MARDIFRLAYSVRMAAEDSAEVMLYGEIIEDMPKWWKWSEEDKSAAEFDKAIKDVVKGGAKKLLLRINSPGGICTQAIAMRSILGNAGFEEINIRIEGMCASAATDIATIPGAHVAICEGSEYMIHNPWCYVSGNAADLEHAAQRLRNIEQTCRGFYTRKSGQSDEQIKEWMDAETWFTAEQAVEYGFADELITAEMQNETPAAACVSSREMAVMHGIYKCVPAQIRQHAEHQSGNQTISNAAPVAGGATEIDHHEEEQDMEIRDINMDQLRAENPALFEQIQHSAIEADRQRREDIDAITPPGAEYEAMAEAAKRDGMSFTEYQKQIVAAQKKKGQDFMEQRHKETAPSAGVGGGSAEHGATNEDEIKQNASDILKYAREYRGSADGTMF